MSGTVIESADGLDMKDNCNSIDFGAAIGISYELPVLPLGVFARYTQGLSNIIKDSSESNKNQVISFGAYVTF